ncbi:MAG: hypothetical protein V1913_08455 [Fibrobacterota bacterium]
MKTIILALLLLGLVSSPFAASRGTFTGVRAMGAGNAASANLDDASAMLYNPACLDLFMEHMQLSVNLAFYGSSGLMDLASFAVNQGKKLTSTEGIKNLDARFYDDLYKLDGNWSTVGLIPNVAFMARTLGLTYGASYYWNIPTRVMLESGVLVPKVVIGTQMDQIFTASAAKRFYRMFSVGASVKWIDRYVVDDIVLGYTQSLEFIDKFKGNTHEKLSVLDPYLDHQYGPGIDLGALYHFGEWRMALSMQDAFAYVGSNVLSPRLNLGASYKLLKLMEIKGIDDATLSLDVADMFRQGNFITKLNLGAELRIAHGDVRGGIHQGYITAGAGLHFFIFNFDYLYYVEELGLYSGTLPLKYHLIQLGADIKF